MRLALSRSVVTAVGLAGAIAACGTPEGGDTAETEASVTAPDTTGAAIWAYIHDSNYGTEWQLWPGKGRLYTGRDPHGMLLTTYLNDIAYQALTGGAAAMPEGAIVVKENYTPDSTLAAITTMFKVSGYNAEHNDWFFTKHLANGQLDTMPNGMEMEGRLPGCQGCHGGVRANDYLFTGPLGGN